MSWDGTRDPMAGIPFNTTTITNWRQPDTANEAIDPYDGPPEYTPTPSVKVFSGARAVISTPSVNTSLSTGTKVVFNAQMRTDLVDIQTLDTITDDPTGRSWTCLNVEPRFAFGLDFLIVSLRSIDGQSS